MAAAVLFAGGLSLSLWYSGRHGNLQMYYLSTLLTKPNVGKQINLFDISSAFFQVNNVYGQVSQINMTETSVCQCFGSCVVQSLNVLHSCSEQRVSVQFSYLKLRIQM